MTDTPKRRGRPPNAPVPTPHPVTIEIHDQRPELTPRLVGRHYNVPSDWTKHDIIKRFGIAEHLHVIRIDADGARAIVQEGRR